MKRQQSLTEFLTKKSKLDSVVSELAWYHTVTAHSQAQPIQPEESSTSIVKIEPDDDLPIENSLPDCWTVQQYNHFKEKYEGLEISNKKLGCEYCEKFDFIRVKSSHVSKQWKGFQIEASGKNKVIQQASLRKKMKEHFSSKAHNICKANFLKKCEQESIIKVVDTMDKKYLSTCRIFNTVYSLSKRCKPFSDIEDEIELQIKNGLDMGIGLHSRKTAVKIVDFIAKDIKKEIFTKITEYNQKICLIIDESSTISCKPVIILFLKVEDSVSSPTIFVELVELEKQDAETICSSVMESLTNAGLTKNYLQNNLIGFCSDGTSVMLGRNSGVSTRLAKEFPNMIWHCLNHRLQLVLDDSIKGIQQVNHFNFNSYSIPESVQRAKNIVRTIAVSSAEAEREFVHSKMNIICSEKRSRLTVSNISNIMIIGLLGLPLREWNPTPTVQRWLRIHHTADDARIKVKKIASEDDNQTAIWKYLQ